MVSARGVLSALREAADGFAQTIVMVTHDPVAAASADAVQQHLHQARTASQYRGTPPRPRRP
jgi:ABC-type lipoprotein export system ATPase subunit